MPETNLIKVCIEITEGERMAEGLHVQESFQCICLQQLYSLVNTCMHNERAT